MEGSPPAEARRPPRPPRQHGQSGGRSPERPEAARGPHTVLEGKVKALKEKRGGRPGTPAAAPERPSPKKPRARRGKAGAEAEPRAQLRTYLTDGLLDGGEPAPGSPPAPRPATPGLWRVPAPPAGPELPPDKGSRSWRSASIHERPSRDEEARTPLRDRGRPSVSPPRAESWERLSLAERVERNRRLLQEVLGLAAPGVYFGKVVALSGHLGEVGGKAFGMMGVLRAILQFPAASHPRAIPSPSLGCRRCS